MRNWKWLTMVGLLATAAACKATADANQFGGAGGSDFAASGAGGEAEGEIFPGMSGSTGAGAPADCNTNVQTDDDGDGFSDVEGDCNDCDPFVNPGAIEVIATEPGPDGVVPPPADEDCDGIVDNVAPTCDAGLALDDFDPLNGARALDLCQTATPTDKRWGVLAAHYVRADGTPGAVPSQVGIFDSFGDHVNPQGGARMLALSSGTARRPQDPGACAMASCDGSGYGSAPPAFPQPPGPASGCPTGDLIFDDVALEVKVRTPKNAIGLAFNLDFYSFEYPEWLCMQYNDQFVAIVNPQPAGSFFGNVAFDPNKNPISVNVSFFQVCSGPGCSRGTNELLGTGFDTWSDFGGGLALDDAGATGWLTTTAPIVGGQEIAIRFAMWDAGDPAFDSTTLIDNFRWIARGGTVTVGTEPLPTPK